jgi:hypothetical protein
MLRWNPTSSAYTELAFPHAKVNQCTERSTAAINQANRSTVQINSFVTAIPCAVGGSTNIATHIDWGWYQNNNLTSKCDSSNPNIRRMQSALTTSTNVQVTAINPAMHSTSVSTQGAGTVIGPLVSNPPVNWVYHIVSTWHRSCKLVAKQ